MWYGYIVRELVFKTLAESLRSSGSTYSTESVGLAAGRHLYNCKATLSPVICKRRHVSHHADSIHLQKLCSLSALPVRDQVERESGEK